MDIIAFTKRIYKIILFTLAEVYYLFPTRGIFFIGVTGTSGKSTTCAILYHLLHKAGFKVGLISTLGALYGSTEIKTGLHVTTPDLLDIVRIISEMKKLGAEYIIIESSSHALAQGRLGLLKFSLAIVTNVTRDHLDWHKTWDNYIKAKAIIIDKLLPKGMAFINKDDTNSYRWFLNNKKSNLYTLKEFSKKDISDITLTKGGISFIYRGSHFLIPILGEYNIDNLLAVIEVGVQLGISLNHISEILSTFYGIKGRMEIIQKEPFTIIVDFAHNSDSLEKALLSLRKIVLPQKKIITVFGSAGLRDKEKRFTMGEISGSLSDVTIITAEDPRTESLSKINSRIIEGAQKVGNKLLARFTDHDSYQQYINKGVNTFILGKSIFAFDEETVQGRYDAINFAIRIANPGDIIVCEGKGHEESLCFGSSEYSYTEYDAIKKALNNNLK